MSNQEGFIAYYIDLTNTPVELDLVHESDFDGDKKDVLFNYDAKGVHSCRRGEIELG